MPSKGEQLPRADLIHCHPEFKSEIVGPPGAGSRLSLNDICMLRADHTMQFGRYVNKVGLPWLTYDQIFRNKTLLIFGYGETEDEDEEYSKKLLSTHLKLLSHEECEVIFNYYVTVQPTKDPSIVYPDKYDRKTNICGKSADEVPRSPCDGDSGGSLIYRDSISECPIIIGIIASGSAPMCRSATRFVKVAAYRTWIENTMQRFKVESSPDRIPYYYPQRNRNED